MSLECECESYEDGMGLLTNITIMAHMHGMSLDPDDIVEWSYCPYCGKKLIEVEDE